MRMKGIMTTIDYTHMTVMKNYTHESFAALVKKTIANINELSEKKGGEYAGDGDRLANFRRNALAFGLTKEQVWGVYAGKHWDAIAQYINDGGNGIKRDRLESISGRADDLIVYLLLFKAMVEENGD